MNGLRGLADVRAEHVIIDQPPPVKRHVGCRPRNADLCPVPAMAR